MREWTSESDLNRYRAAANQIRTEISRASDTVATKRKKASDAFVAAGRSKSATTIRTKTAEADRATRDAIDAEKKRAGLEKKLAETEANPRIWAVATIRAYEDATARETVFNQIVDMALNDAGDEQQPYHAGVPMRRGAPSHPASTEQISELRAQGFTWNEVAEQVGITVSGAWSRYRRPQPPRRRRLGRWQQVLADA
jgi:hypothetical protein